MLIDFESISSNARLWIYQIDRELNDAEEKQLLEDTLQFLEKWAAHGSQLKAAVKVVSKRILLIAADETFSGASGCSIDSQMAYLREEQIKLGIDLFSRSSIFYVDNDMLNSMDINEFKQKIATGELSDETLFYNTTIHKKEQLSEGFIIPVKNSWLMKMITV